MGKIILLNGPSSSGKSTIAKALQVLIKEQREENYGIVSVDDFLNMSVNEPIFEDDVFEISDKLNKKVIDLLETSDGVIVDHVITSKRIYDGLMERCGSFDLISVKVYCSLDILKHREKERENRSIGSAEASLEYLYPKDGYDLTVDNSTVAAKECAEKLFKQIEFQ